MPQSKPKLLVILGPTAVGKSGIALDLARRFGAEVVGADSLQVYRYLDIGTAKPCLEDRRAVAHHMIDIVDPDEEFNAGLYVKLARGTIEERYPRARRLIVVGGTFLYVRLLLYGMIEDIPGDRGLRRRLRREREEIGTRGMYERLKSIDPPSSEAIHPNDYVRIERALEAFYLTGERMSRLQDRHAFGGEIYDALKIALYDGREQVEKRIERRAEEMIERGVIDEVKEILARGYSPELKPLKSIGYREIIAYLAGDISLEKALGLIKRDTKRYAKRQMTWLRRERDLKWYHPEGDYSRILKDADRLWL